MSYQEIQGHRLTPEQATDRWLRWGIRLGKGVLVLLVFALVGMGVVVLFLVDLQVEMVMYWLIF